MGTQKNPEITVTVRKDGGYNAFDQTSREIPGLGMFLYHTQQRFKFGQTSGVLVNPLILHNQNPPTQVTLDFFSKGPGNCPNWEITIPEDSIIPEINYNSNHVVRLAVAGKWGILDQIYNRLIKARKNDELRFLIQTEKTFQRPSVPEDREPFYDGQSYISESLSQIRTELGIDDDIKQLDHLPELHEFLSGSSKEQSIHMMDVLYKYPYREPWLHIQNTLMPEMLQAEELDPGNNRAKVFTYMFLFCQRMNRIKGSPSKNARNPEDKTQEYDKNWMRRIKSLLDQNEQKAEQKERSKYSREEEGHYACWKGRIFQQLFVLQTHMGRSDKDHWVYQHLQPLRAWTFSSKRMFHGCGMDLENATKKRKDRNRWDDNGFSILPIAWEALEQDSPIRLPLEEVRTVANAADKSGVSAMLLPEPGKRDYNKTTPPDIFDNNLNQEKPICTNPKAAFSLFQHAIRHASRMDNPLETLIHAWAHNLFSPETYPWILRSIELALKKANVGTQTKKTLEELREKLTEQLV